MKKLNLILCVLALHTFFGFVSQCYAENNKDTTQTGMKISVVCKGEGVRINSQNKETTFQTTDTYIFETYKNQLIFTENGSSTAILKNTFTELSTLAGRPTTYTDWTINDNFISIIKRGSRQIDSKNLEEESSSEDLRIERYSGKWYRDVERSRRKSEREPPLVTSTYKFGECEKQNKKF